MGMGIEALEHRDRVCRLERNRVVFCHTGKRLAQAWVISVDYCQIASPANGLSAISALRCKCCGERGYRRILHLATAQELEKKAHG